MTDTSESDEHRLMHGSREDKVAWNRKMSRLRMEGITDLLDEELWDCELVLVVLVLMNSL